MLPICVISISIHFIKIFGASGMSHLFCNSKVTLSIYLSLEDCHWICRKVKSSNSKSNFFASGPSYLALFWAAFGVFSFPLFLQHAHLFVVGSAAPHCSVPQNCPALRTLLHSTASEMGFGYSLLGLFQIQFRCSSLHLQCRIQLKFVSMRFLVWPGWRSPRKEGMSSETGRFTAFSPPSSWRQ